jgi:hypothetical protein
MLTPSYAQTTNDPYLLWANLAEWVQRENLYLAAHPELAPDTKLVTLPFARDAGDVCGVCGNLVTWVDHLPPVKSGEPVRCAKVDDMLDMMLGYRSRQDVLIDDIFKRVD